MLNVLGLGYSELKINPHLKMAVQRKMEHIIRDDFMIEAYELLELLCELLHERTLQVTRYLMEIANVYKVDWGWVPPIELECEAVNEEAPFSTPSGYLENMAPGLGLTAAYGGGSGSGDAGTPQPVGPPSAKGGGIVRKPSPEEQAEYDQFHQNQTKAGSAPSSQPTQVYAAVPGPRARMNTQSQSPQYPSAGANISASANASAGPGPAAASPASPLVPTVQGFAVAPQHQQAERVQDLDYLQPEEAKAAPQLDMYSKPEGPSPPPAFVPSPPPPPAAAFVGPAPAPAPALTLAPALPGDPMEAMLARLAALQKSHRRLISCKQMKAALTFVVVALLLVMGTPFRIPHRAIRSKCGREAVELHPCAFILPERRSPDDIEPSCKRAVELQPHVLVIPKTLSAEKFIEWHGTVVRLKLASQPILLPFVNRMPTLSSMMRVLTENNEVAQTIAAYPVQTRSLRLVGSGALFGAGKTKIGEVIFKCLQLEYKEQKKVLFCLIDGVKSPSDMWMDNVVETEGMEGLGAKISRKMSWSKLLKETSKHLADNDSMLFLHLDEFVPFDKSRKLKNTRENFYSCWQDMLMPILKTPGIFLYISGRMPYFDTIGTGHESGGSPCSVLSVQLDLFGPNVILDALRKMALPALPGAGDHTSSEAANPAATIPLSEALDVMLPMSSDAALPETGRARDIARRLHELTGGVPRFVEHALHALLMDPVIHAALFRGERQDAPEKRLDALFSENGAACEAVVEQASKHFSAAIGTTALLQYGDEKRDDHVAGLLILAFLQGQALQVGSEDLDSLKKSMQLSEDPELASFLFREALFWGFHRDVHLEDKTVRFPVSAAVLAGLKLALKDLRRYLPSGLQYLQVKKREKDSSGKSAEMDVQNALMFHGLMISATEHYDWLGAGKSSTGMSAVSLSANTKPFSLKLPRLPKVASDGVLSTVEEVREITFPSSKDAADTRSCPPRLMGQFIDSLSADEFHALAPAPQSASADFFVRHGDQLTHLQVRDTQNLHVQKILQDCGKTAAVAEGASNLNNTLVWVMMQNQGLEHGKKCLASLVELLNNADVSAEEIAAAAVPNSKVTISKLLKKYVENKESRRGRRGRGATASEGDIANSVEAGDHIVSSVEAGDIASSVEAGEIASSVEAGDSAVIEGSDAECKRSVAVAVRMFKEKKLHLLVLDETQRGEFLRYNRIADALFRRA